MLWLSLNIPYALKGLMLKLKLQCFGHLIRKTDSLEKTLMLGKIEGRRRRGWQRMTRLDDITNSMDMGWGGFRQLVMDMEVWCTVIHGVPKSWTRLRDWTELNSWVRKSPCRKKLQPIPVFFPGECHGQRRLQVTVHEVTKNQTWLSSHKHMYLS